MQARSGFPQAVQGGAQKVTSTDILRAFEQVVACRGPIPSGELIGESRAGRPLRGFRFGDGTLRVNLVGGCHADEPVGPRLLWHLVRYLASDAGAELAALARWSVIPHLNPDGAAANVPWQQPDVGSYDVLAFLRHGVRELPGDDIEFGFPRSRGDFEARPENQAADAFWRSGAPYDLHVSLHGMSVAAGPYFLVERSWWSRFESAAEDLAGLVVDGGYVLHDVERHGEKGFHRLAPGFCSRPDSRPMLDHFLALGDPEMAARFRPSSMESIRSMGGDPLTLVTEMPLFLTPGVGVDLGPPDPVLVEWRSRIQDWRGRIRSAPEDPFVGTSVREEAANAGLEPMPVHDQMRFQWAFIAAGIGVVG